MTYELGFIGAGNMAEAIARAALDKGVLSAGQMIASDPAEPRRGVFAALGIAATDDNAQVIAQSKQVLLAVKPQMMAAAAADLAAHLREDQVVLSIMAGITTAKLSAAVGRPVRCVRIMPNTPLQVGYGMAGVAMGQAARPGDDELAMRLFSAAGEAVRVEEAKLDAVTAVSGSGPAYVFYLAEAMEKAARELGLGDDAPRFVRQTILGAAQLLAQSEHPPAELRRLVTSPGGTTAAAIRHMDGNSTTAVIVNAVKAAHKRSIELGQ